MINFISQYRRLIIGIFLLGLIAGTVIYLICKDKREEGKIRSSTIIKIVITGIMASLSSVLMYYSFPIFPAMNFLKIEFSVLAIFLVFIWFDFRTAVLVSIIANLVDSFLKGGMIPFMDQSINFIATMIFMIPFVFAFKNLLKNQYEKSHILPSGRVIVTGILAVALTSVVMVLVNLLVVIPVYDYLTHGGITATINSLSPNFYQGVFTYFGSFNLIHWGLIGIAIVLLGTPLAKVKDQLGQLR